MWGALGLAALLVAGCAPTLQQETGVILTIDSPALGTVDGFTLRTADGRVLAFDTRGLRFDQGGFPAVHLSEHQAVADPVEVTYQVEDGRNIVTRLDDAPAD